MFLTFVPLPCVLCCARYDLVDEFEEALSHALERGKCTKVVLRGPAAAARSPRGRPNTPP